jgi:hypothetical protein
LKSIKKFWPKFRQQQRVDHEPAEGEDVPLGEGGVYVHDRQRQVDEPDLQDQPDQGRAGSRRQLVGAGRTSRFFFIKYIFICRTSGEKNSLLKFKML